MAAIENSENQDAILNIHSGYTRLRTSRSRTRKRTSDLFWNVLTILVWLGTATLLMAFISIYVDPASSLNVLRPFQPTLAAAIVFPSETPAPATETSAPIPTMIFTETATLPPPTLTPTLEPTATETPTPGPSSTPTVHTIYPFILRNDPVAIAGDAIPDHDNCKLWVAGQTYDLQGAPMVGITVMLGGSLKGKTLYQLSLTGTSLQFGQAGYEFIVADEPSGSEGIAWVQLFDQALIPLSGRIFFNTFEDCKQNLILINFKQVR